MKPVVNDSVITELLDAIPESLRGLSGTALYTGLDSWTNSSPLYLMGINPGGQPGTDTIYGNAENLLHNGPANYSAYRDERWATGSGRLYEPRQHRMQKSVLHLLDVLGLDPGLVPTSNMVTPAAGRLITSRRAA